MAVENLRGVEDHRRSWPSNPPSFRGRIADLADRRRGLLEGVDEVCLGAIEAARCSRSRLPSLRLRRRRRSRRAPAPAPRPPGLREGGAVFGEPCTRTSAPSFAGEFHEAAHDRDSPAVNLRVLGGDRKALGTDHQPMEGRADDARIGQASPQGSDFARPKAAGVFGEGEGGDLEGVVAELRGESRIARRTTFRGSLHCRATASSRAFLPVSRHSDRRRPALLPKAGLHLLFTSDTARCVAGRGSPARGRRAVPRSNQTPLDGIGIYKLPTVR